MKDVVDVLSPRVVLYIDSLKTGGAEKITLTLANWLHQAGWTPVVLTRKSLRRDFYPIPAGVERAVEPVDPDWLRALGWFGFPWRVQRLRRWIRLERVGLVIGMTTLPAIKLLLATRSLTLPCVVSERNYPPARRPALPWRLLRRLTYPWADLHLVQTHATGNWLARHLGAKYQLRLPNPVQWPLPRFDPAPEPKSWLSAAGVDADAPLLLAAGTKAHQKGFDRLVQAFGLLAVRFPDLQLVILGLESTRYKGVDQLVALRSLLPRNGDFQARLHLPGRVGNIGEWYQRARIFALPSRYEGFPNVLLEAMASGCACVASDCLTGPADLIENERNGILLPSKATAADWVSVLGALLDDSDRCAALGTEAINVRQRYSEVLLRKIFIKAIKDLRPVAST
tara:strand:+ start:56 stop:1246 length:1191 start_codon:yes stop_codon:yes gene_type:complete